MSTAEKIARLCEQPDPAPVPRCFAYNAPGSGWIVVDLIDPATGKTGIYESTLDEIRQRHPDAEEMDLDEVLSRRAAQQDTPITWEPTTRERFDEMMNVLPPVAPWGDLSKGFLVGEAYDHHATTGRARYQAFRKIGPDYFQSSRPLTVAEWREVNA